MKIFIKMLYHVLLLVVLINFGCTGKNKESNLVEIQESINEQIGVAKEYLANKKNGQAIELLESLLKQHPNMTNIIEALGFAYMDLGDPKLAAFYFEQIIKKVPTSHEYRIFAAQAYMEAKDFTSASRNYKEYLVYFPNDRSTWKALAKAYEMDKNDTLALEAYLQAEQLTRSPASEKDALKIARLYLKLNNVQESKTWYHLVLTHNANSLEARTRLLKLELQSENWSEAKSHLAKIESLPTSKVDPKLIQVAKDILAKRTSLGARPIVKSVAKKPDVNLYLKEAREQKSANNFVGSIDAFKKAIEITPKSANIWHELGLVYMDNNNYQEAEKNVKEAMAIDPDNIKYVFNYLKIIKKGGSNERLIDELIKVKEHFPNNAEFTLALAQAYHKQGDEKAKGFYEEFLVQAPDHAKKDQVKKILSSF